MSKKAESKKSLIIYFIISLFFIISCSDDNCDSDSCNRAIDVAFLIDTSGSMDEAIEDVKSNVTNIVNAIKIQSEDDYSLSLSIFDDHEPNNPLKILSYSLSQDYMNLPADQKIVILTNKEESQPHLTMLEKFGENNDVSFSEQMNKINKTIFKTGTNTTKPEPGGLLLNEVLNNGFAGDWRKESLKIVVIITDNVAGGDDGIADVTDTAFLESLAEDANSSNIKLILISSFASSNYEISLISNNDEGEAFIQPNLSDAGSEIADIITRLCE